MASERTMTESVRVLTPFCVAEAKAEPEQVKLLKAIDTYSRNQFIQDKTAWLVGMEKKYHYEVAGPCATKAVEAMEASAKPS